MWALEGTSRDKQESESMKTPRSSVDGLRVLRGIVQVLLFAVAAKAVGGVKEIVIAARYGASATLDGYLFTYEWNFWFVSLMVSVFVFILVPFIIELRQKDWFASKQFVSEAILVAIVVGLAIGLAMWGMFPFLIAWVGMEQQAYDAALYANLWIPWLITTGLVSGVFTATLISRERHWGNLLEGVPALGMCFVIGLWAAADVRPLVWGTVMGFVSQVVILGILTRFYGDPVFPSRHLNKAIWRRCLRGLGALAVGQAILSVSGLIDTVLATRLEAGALARYSYALRVNALLLGIFASGFGRACLPVFSDLLLGKGYTHARAAALRWSYASFGLGAGIALLGVLTAPIIVRLLFERGAFTSQDTLVVSHVLQMMLFQAPLYLMWVVLQTWLAVSKNYYPIVWACTIAIITKLITGVWLSELLGIAGVALSTVAMYGVAVGYTWICATRRR